MSGITLPLDLLDWLLMLTLKHLYCKLDLPRDPSE